MRAAAACLCGGALAVALAGCESTVDAAKKLSAEGAAALNQKGITVTRPDRQIRVLSSTVISDPNGTAVVVTLRNDARAAIADAPIAINVLGATGRSVFRNDAPGEETDLVHVPLLLPGRAFDWINDQVLADGKPATVQARVGGGAAAPKSLPSIAVSSVTLTNDPTSGYAASGKVSNDSNVPQTQLVLFAVARRGRKVVAAGRAIVARLLPHKTLAFHAFLLGNPRGARLSVSAPPSTL